MKQLLTLFAVVSLMLSACTKSSLPPAASTAASLSFVNATVGSSPVVYKFNNPNVTYSTVTSSNKISYGASNLFSLISGNVATAVVQSTDTLHTLFNGNLNLQTNGIYSLYLCGTTAQPDTVFIKENLMYHSANDSIAGIRFVNLSQNSNSVSVDIKGLANGSEAASLAFKGRTTFKTYKADHTVASYIFEFRDATLGTLLATYTLSGVNNASSASLTTTNTVRFHNLTLALIGGGTASQSALLIPNY